MTSILKHILFAKVTFILKQRELQFLNP